MVRLGAFVCFGIAAATQVNAMSPVPPPRPYFEDALRIRKAIGLPGHFSGEVWITGGYGTTGILWNKIFPPGSLGVFSDGHDVWRFASVTKQVVAVAAMQQVEAGTLALDAPVARYDPQIGIANADRVTIRQLLQHTSGISNPEDGPKDADGIPLQYLRNQPASAIERARADGPAHIRSLVQRDRAIIIPLPAACTGKPTAAPGARFSYNNCDYEALGRVLEAVTHQPLARLLQERIFTPAGMTRTRLLAPGEDSGRPGFDAKGKDDRAIDVGRFGPAGALAGPPADLAAFDRALMDGRLLKPAMRAEMWRGDPKLGYAALGAWVYPAKLKGCAAPQRLVERRGEIGNVQVRNVIAPDRGIAVIAFADHPVDFGEPWQGKGLTYDLMSAALCPAA